MQVHEQTSISTALHPSKVWERPADDVYSILTSTYIEHFFRHVNLHQNVKSTIEEEINGELAFLDNLLKRNNGKISVLVYRKPTHTGKHLHYTYHAKTNCKQSLIPSLLNRANCINTNKYGLIKKDATINPVLKDN